MTWLRWIPRVGITLAIACGGDDDDGGGETQGSSTASTTSATTTTDATTSDGSGSEATTASTSASTTAADSSSSDAGSSEASGSESGGAPCGDGDPCAGDQICVLPCCGGPAPPCIDMPRGGCDPEDTEVPADQCNAPCSTPTCCIDNCVADPPYCAQTADLMCNGGTNCSIDSCFGTVSNGQLLCECA